MYRAFGVEEFAKNGGLQMSTQHGVTVTVTSNLYRPRLGNIFDEHGQENVCFQQDGATAHKSRHSMEILQ